MNRVITITMPDDIMEAGTATLSYDPPVEGTGRTFKMGARQVTASLLLLASLTDAERVEPAAATEG